MSAKKIVFIFLAVILGSLLLGGSCVYSGYNQAIVLDEGVKSRWAQVENQLQRRFELIPNLIETVKGIAGQEEKIFLGVAEARKAIGPRIPFSGDDVRAAVTAALVRLAWARSSGDALADPIDAWTGRWLRRTFARNAVGPVLRQLSIGYAPAAKWSVEDRERLRTAVPAAARAMWTALQGGEK